MNNSFERELPSEYRQAYHIDAKEKKTGLIMNLAAFIICLAVVGLGCLAFLLEKDVSFEIGINLLIPSYLIFIAGMLIYIVIHELLHGVAYKALTKEKLSFGLSWSCAFCGVPNIYVYKRVALIALVTPLITLTVVLLPIVIMLFFLHPVCYILGLILFGMHLGGCIGDAFVTYLLLFKFKGKTLLIRDTGPEQFIYEKENG